MTVRTLALIANHRGWLDAPLTFETDGEVLVVHGVQDRLAWTEVDGVSVPTLDLNYRVAMS